MHLSQWEENMERTLVATESHTISGQLQKIELIKNLLGHDHNCTLELQEFDIVERIREGDGMHEVTRRVHNLLVRKGTRHNPKMRIFVPTHVDTVRTVERDDDWYDRYVLKTDPRNPDRMIGLGAGDENAAIVIAISLARTLQVPKDKEVVFGFMLDEEDKSRGAKNIIDEWEDWESVDLVISNEIGPLKPDNFDGKIPVIIGRDGIAKFDFDMEMSRGGHAAIDEEVFNPVDEFAEWLVALRREFKDPSRTPPLRRTHPYLGQEKINGWRVRSHGPEGANNCRLIEAGVKLQMVSGTLQERLEEQMACCDRIAEQMEWSRKSIKKTLSLNSTQTSYPSYCIDPEHEHVKELVKHLKDFAVLHKKSNQPLMEIVPTGVPAWADENLYAQRGKTVLGLPYRTGRAHEVGEWVSRSSMAQVRELMIYIITHGFTR